MTEPAAKKAGTFDVVRSTHPPLFAHAIPLSKSPGFRLTWVGRNWVDRQLRLVDEAREEREASGTVPEVDVEDAGLPREDPSPMRVGGDPGELLEGGLGGTVVRDGDLAGADHLLDEEEVPLDASGEREERHTVGAGEDEGRKAFLLECVRLREEDGKAPGDAVGAETPDDGRHPSANGVAERELGSPARVAAFSSAARDVDVSVDEARDGEEAVPGDDLGQLARERDAGGHPLDLPCRREGCPCGPRGRA